MTNSPKGQIRVSESRWRKPRLRVTSDAERERHASWIDSFFDLVFAVVITQLSYNLKQNLSVIGFLEFAALFVPCWWAWVLFTFYADRYDTDDVIHRLGKVSFDIFRTKYTLGTDEEKIVEIDARY